jgi:hypothetical protein
MRATKQHSVVSGPALTRQGTNKVRDRILRSERLCPRAAKTCVLARIAALPLESRSN